MKPIKTHLTQLGNWLASSKVRFFTIIGILLALLLLLLDYRNGFDWTGIQVEAHGMLFDIILFGILLTVYETITSRQRQVKSYMDQLESFRDWYGEEAAFRVKYIVDELNKLGVSDLTLENLHLGKLNKELVEDQRKRGNRISCLADADILNIDLQKANLKKSIFKEANLTGANFEKADLSFADFENAFLPGSNFDGVDLTFGGFENAYLVGSNFKGVNLRTVNFKGANVSSVNFEGADLLTASFEGAIIVDANFENTVLYDTTIPGAAANFKGAKAFQGQMESFRKVMTKDQLSDIEWFIEPDISTYSFDQKESNSITKGNEISMQCIAIAKSTGKRCRRKPKLGYDKCSIHL
ncbi:MAG: pentapeptide repeat-containing protein [Bacteroidota bacterium]